MTVVAYQAAAQLRRERKRRGLTQDPVAQAIMTTRKRRSLYRPGDDVDNITQSFISQMERGARPIPTRERELAQDVTEPSIHDELVALFEQSGDELRGDIGPPKAGHRGPYDV